MKLVLIFLFLTSCAGQQDVLIVASPLRPYYDRFLVEAKRQNVTINTDNLILEMVDELQDLELGVCSVNNEIRIIKVLSSTWKPLTDAGKEQIVYHELGHCGLGRAHLDGTLLDGSPRSIMNSKHFNDSAYLYYHDYYMHELFHF